MADDGERVMQDDLGSQDGKEDGRGDGNLFYFNLDTFPFFFSCILRSHSLQERVFLHPFSGAGRYSGYSDNKELSSKSLKIQNKVYYMDVKENRRGRFLKITEVNLRPFAPHFSLSSKWLQD